MRNEFAGVEGGAENASAAISALQNLEKQRFNREEFAAALSELEVDKKYDANRLLTFLFYAGAIGNYVMRGDETYMQFYHRRDESEIYLKGQFLLHNALVHCVGYASRRIAYSLHRDISPSTRPQGQISMSP